MEEKTCKYCLENETENDLISPCDCKGTQKWVHRTCLDKWRTTISLDIFHDHFYQCELCYKKFQFEHVILHRTLWENVYPFLITLVEFLIVGGIFFGSCFGVGCWYVTALHPSFLGNFGEMTDIWLYGFIFVHVCTGILIMIFGVCISGGGIYGIITGDTEGNNTSGIIVFIILFTIGAITFIFSTLVFFGFILYRRYTYYSQRDVRFWVVKDLSLVTHDIPRNDMEMTVHSSRNYHNFS